MKLAVLPVIALFAALPAEAATIPPVDLAQGRYVFSVGSMYIPGATNTLGGDWNLDFGLTDRFSLGLSTTLGVNLYPNHDVLFVHGILRGTYRLGRLGWAEHGVSASLGVSATPMGPPGQYFPWGQVAWNVAMPLGGLDSPWRLSFTVGPLLYPRWQRLLPPIDYVWPNLEITYRFSDTLTAVLGGNALYGMRWVF